VSDGVSAEQPLSPGGLGNAQNYQQTPWLSGLSQFGNAGGEHGTATLGY